MLRTPSRWIVMATAAAALAGCVVVPAGPGHRRAPAAAPPPAPTSGVAMYFYPARGQTLPEQERDRYECYRWAVAQTGVDPGMTPVRQPPPSMVAPPSGAEVVAGAATGAVVGAAVSSPRHAGEGAVIGAIFGAMVGAASADARQRAVESAAERRRATSQATMSSGFGRAMSACMEARGYRVR